MAKQRKNTHAELDELRQRAGAERVKSGDLEAQLHAAKAKVEGASRGITAGYEAEDERAVDAARRELQAAEAEVADLGYRLAAAELRVERTLRRPTRSRTTTPMTSSRSASNQLAPSRPS